MTLETQVHYKYLLSFCVSFPILVESRLYSFFNLPPRYNFYLSDA